MNHRPSNNEHPAPSPSFWARPGAKAWITLALVTAFYLLREHWGHIAGWWPYLLLAACPLMHMLHGHGGHQHGNPSEPDSAQRDETREGK